MTTADLQNARENCTCCFPFRISLSRKSLNIYSRPRRNPRLHLLFQSATDCFRKSRKFDKAFRMSGNITILILLRFSNENIVVYVIFCFCHILQTDHTHCSFSKSRLYPSEKRQLAVPPVMDVDACHSQGQGQPRCRFQMERRHQVTIN